MGIWYREAREGCGERRLGVGEADEGGKGRPGKRREAGGGEWTRLEEGERGREGKGVWGSIWGVGEESEEGRGRARKRRKAGGGGCGMQEGGYVEGGGE